jgi:hypothetical protein
VDEPKPAASAQRIGMANEVAAQHQNPVAQLVAALVTAATSPANPHLMIDSLLQAIPRMIAARIPLDQQSAIAGEVEARLSKLLVAWELK